jgi:hypothetical protein
MCKEVIGKREQPSFREKSNLQHFQDITNHVAKLNTYKHNRFSQNSHGIRRY